MVDYQIRRRGVTDQDVLAAMERVPRHEFVPADLQSQAYTTGHCLSAMGRPSPNPTLWP